MFLLVGRIEVKCVDEEGQVNRMIPRGWRARIFPAPILWLPRGGAFDGLQLFSSCNSSPIHLVILFLR